MRARIDGFGAQRLGATAFAGVAALLALASAATASTGQISARAARARRVAPPSVSKVSPRQGTLDGGTKVTIRGSGFVKVKAVDFGATKSRKLKVISKTRLTAVAPAHASGKVAVTVRTAAGTSRKSKAADYLFYLVAPAVSSISPSSGTTAGGTTVTITGRDFIKVKHVEFGNVLGTNVQVVSPTKLTATTPAHAAGRVSVMVLTSGGGSKTSSATSYTYVTPAPITPSAPTISSITPSTGVPWGGGTVTIDGSNFVTGATVTFGSIATSADVVSDDELQATVPEHVAGQVAVSVSTAYGTSAASSAATYTYSIPTASSPTLSILAGVGHGPTPGPAASTALDGSWGVALDSTTGDLYIADADSALIEQVTPSGALSIVAGIPGESSGAHPSGGSATATPLSFPTGVAVDSSGDIFIADIGTNTVDEVNHLTGDISVIAGGGGGVPTTTASTATSDNLNSPVGIALNSSGEDLYIADRGRDEIYELNTQSSTDNLTVIAGGGSDNPSTTPQSATGVALNDPSGVAVDGSGNVYIADTNNDVIEKLSVSGGDLSVIAGVDGTSGTPTMGLATSSDLYQPQGVGVDADGDVYIGDSHGADSYVERVDHSSGDLSFVAGTGSVGEPMAGPALSSPLSSPRGLAISGSGDLYIGDYGDATVDKVTSGTLSIFAGVPWYQAPTPGQAVDSAMNQPAGVAVDGYGNLFVADQANNVVERINAQTGDLSIFAGDGPTVPTTTPEPSYDADLSNPADVAVDGSGDVYISDTDNNLVEEVSGGEIRAVAGGGGTPPSTAPQAATSVELSAPAGIALAPDGDLYIADSGDDLVLVLTPAGQLSIVAGGGVNAPSTTGQAATGVELNDPSGVAVDSAGNLYIADSGNDVVEKVTGGQLSVFAGTDASSGSPTDGPATSTRLNNPEGVAVDSAGNVYIADSSNRMVEQVSGSTDELSIIAGNSSSSGLPAPGAPLSTALEQPVGITVDSSGNVYITDWIASDLIEISGL